MDVTLAIDFTISNQDPQLPNSNHYHTSNQRSLYGAAIHALQPLLQKYNSNNWYHVYGFGAKKKENHEDLYPFFSITFDNEKPYCTGVEEILKKYRSCLDVIDLFIHFDIVPLIEITIHHIKKNGCYNILIVFTDEYFNDMREFERMLPQVSQLTVKQSIISRPIIFLSVMMQFSLKQ
ncbi:copine-8 [Octopus bimaculoides]|nr:copine-8 [Octopus bimaculoides]|eukprot:XP_014782464.1 PREDICTED: copine-8-like [Octopus bimaculoides]